MHLFLSFISISEIESILDQHPSIKENIVSTYEVAEDLELVAYIILKPEQTLTENELQVSSIIVEIRLTLFLFSCI